MSHSNRNDRSGRGSTQSMPNTKKSKARRTTPPLKFHNFVANSSNDVNGKTIVTTNGVRPTAHCLKEEHGSKQITVSHWHHSEHPPSAGNSTSETASMNQKRQSNEAGMSSTNTSNAWQRNVKRKKCDMANATKMSPPPSSYIRTVINNDDFDQAHHTRSGVKRDRFASRTTDLETFKLSSAAIQSEPLDLSIKKSNTTELSRPSSSTLILKVKTAHPTSQSDQSDCSSKQVSVDPIEPNVVQSPSSQLSLVDHPQSASTSNVADHSSIVKATRNRLDRKVKQSTSAYGDNRSKASNGFLIKTKQVTDGEATFCKFRKLTKYTRYYFKNHQNQAVPEEMSKLWKGFLPPKNAKNASGSNTTL